MDVREPSRTRTCRVGKRAPPKMASRLKERDCAGVRLISGASACDDVSMPTPGMPLRAALIPDCTRAEAHHAAYSSARINDAIFVCVARQGRRWKVELDAMASSKPIVPHQAATVLKSAAEQLVSAGTVESGATVGPDYISMYEVAARRVRR